MSQDLIDAVAGRVAEKQAARFLQFSLKRSPFAYGRRGDRRQHCSRLRTTGALGERLVDVLQVTQEAVLPSAVPAAAPTSAGSGHLHPDIRIR